MRLYLIISLLFVSHMCFAQSDSGKMYSIPSRSTTQETNSKNKKKNVQGTTPKPSATDEKTDTLLSKLYYAGSFLGGVILTMAFQFILRRGEVRGSARGKSTIQDLSTNQQERIHALEYQNKQLSNDLQFLKQEKRDMEAQTSKIAVQKEEQITSVIPVQSIDEDATITRVWDDIKNNPTPAATKESYQSVLYFSTPNLSGEFRGGSNTFDEGASIYKFSLISPTEAFFEFCDNKSSVGLALNHRNDLILAVAEESNAFNAGASRIVIDGNQQGQALLEGSFWKVTKKAKIKYI